MHRILEGTTVLDLTRFFSGPQCTLLLAGLGADVVKIDDPKTGDPVAGGPPYAGPFGVALDKRDPGDLGLAYLKRARAKRSATVNLKVSEGRALFLDLAAQADVIVENFRVGVTQRLGIDYAAVAARNPRIVYCSLTGYGATGPEAAVKAYDPMIQAAAGLMSITGHPGSEPLKAGSALSDGISGVFAALGVVSALLQRQRTGAGQFVDVSMAECLFSLLFDEPLDNYDRLGMPFRQGNRITRFSPFNTYPTKDGTVLIGCATQVEWQALLAAMARGDLRDHPDWCSVGWRIANNQQVDALIAEWTVRRATDAVVAALRVADVPCGPVHTIHDILRWTQFAERGVLLPVEHPVSGPVPGAAAAAFPIRFSDAATGYDRPAPTPGADTDPVLRTWLGLDGPAIEDLRLRGII